MTEGPIRRSSWGSLGPSRAEDTEGSAARRMPAPAPTTRLVVLPAFWCVPFTSRLTMQACAERHREPTQQRKTCKTCPVGKAHAAASMPASWPDGTRIDRAPLEVRALVAGPPKGKRTPFA